MIDFSRRSMLLLIILFSIAASLSAQQKDWTSTLRQKKEFIQNNGQCDDFVPKDPVLFMAKADGLQYLFTRSGFLIQKFDRLEKEESKADRDTKELREKEIADRQEQEEEKYRKLEHKVSSYEMRFLGTAADMIVTPLNKKSNYYTFGVIKADAFSQLVYRGIYPQINLVLEFPQDSVGIEYSFILHPGADAADIRFDFPGTGSSAISGGRIQCLSPIGELIHHAPKAFYKDGGGILSEFIRSGSEIGFALEEYDPARTVIIDPWVLTPSFSGVVSAYDVNFDNEGNVYAYGGPNGFGRLTLLKYNSAGTLLWDYTTPWITTYYTDFALDKSSGSTYVTQIHPSEGIGSEIFKINPAGIQVASSPGDVHMDEIWRMDFDSCNHQLVVSGTGTSFEAVQIGTLDTNLTSMSTSAYVSSVFSCNDIASMVIDGYGSCFQLSVRKIAHPDSLTFDNNLTKIPLPALTPAAYSVPSNYLFREISSVYYYDEILYDYNIGYNGLDDGGGFIFSSDGYALKKFDGATGAQLAYRRISYPPMGDSSRMYWGGIAADRCENVFVADSNLVLQFGPGFTLINTYVMPHKVYDIAFYPDGLLYVGGRGFIRTFYPTGLVTCPSDFNYTLTVTDASCNVPGTGTINTGGIPCDVTWSTTPPQTGLTAELPPGTFYVTINTLDCTSEVLYDTVTIIDNGFIHIVGTSQDSTCLIPASASVTSSGINGPFTYLWNTGDTITSISNISSGTYTVSVSDQAGCVDSMVFTITADSSFQLSTTSVATTCALSDGIAEALVSGSSGYTFLWTPSGQTTALADSLPAGEHVVSVTDSAGCHKTDTVMIGASVAPVTSFAFDTYFGCAPLCIFFENTTVTTTYTTFWQWNFGDGTMSITESPTYCYTTPGIYNVTLTAFDTLGCVDTGYASASIVVTEPPQAQFSISPVSPVSSGTPIQFTDESNGASSWYWMFNDSDSTTSTLQNPSFTYPENGEYLAQLVVTNGSCSDTASIFIQVDIGFTIYVPNAFTPNGNGVNELFRPRGVFWKSEGYRFSVFNRWGEQIFQTNDINAGWDGSYKGSVVQQDTYVWKVIVFDYQGKEHQLIGHVTVLR